MWGREVVGRSELTDAWLRRAGVVKRNRAEDVEDACLVSFWKDIYGCSYGWVHAMLGCVSKLLNRYSIGSFSEEGSCRRYLE